MGGLILFLTRVICLLSILTILFPVKGHAAAKVVLSKPIPKSTYQTDNCVNSVANIEHYEKTWTDGNELKEMAQTEFIGFSPMPSIRESVPEMILRRWSRSRGYTDKQIEYLRKVNRSFDPARTSYLGFIHEVGQDNRLNTENLDTPFSGMRVFDGSTQPLYNGLSFSKVSPETRELSFENDLRRQGYTLPERDKEDRTGEASYIWELGLLNVERDYLAGIDTLFGVLARDILDPNYNNNRYNIKSDLTILKQRNLVMYVVCRQTHLAIYKNKGFHLVYDSTTKEPVRTSDDLFLMKIDSVNLMTRYSDVPLRPVKKREKYSVDAEEVKNNRTMMTDYFTSLQEQVPKITSDFDFAVAIYRISQLHEKLFNSDPMELSKHPTIQTHPDANEKPLEAVQLMQHALFFEAYYILAYANLQLLPKSQKHRFNELIAPYEVMINDFTRREWFYKEVMEASRKGEAFPILNKDQINIFLQELTRQLGGREYNLDYLEEWKEFFKI